ncbi:MAG: hypothetical protein ACE5Q4_04690 [Nitrosopumilus sp.]
MAEFKAKKITIREEWKEYYDVMEYLAEEYFNGECYVTKQKYERKGMGIHHLEEKDGDVLKRDYKKQYKRPSTASLMYIRDLMKQFYTDPTLKDRTVLVKNIVHTRLDHKVYGVTKFPMDQRERFVEILMATKMVGRKGRAK